MNENMMQALVDGLSAQLKAERSATQMTLGKMIAALEAMPPDAMPPLARHLIDANGVALLTQWVNSLSTCN